MAINRELHGAPGPWESDQVAEAPDATPKTMPYRPRYRHHLWFIDLRYLVKLESGWVYSICVLEGYSRVILAGIATDHQDLPAVLQLLYTALTAYGCPTGLVSDHGGVFRAQDYQALLQALAVERILIEKGKPWQNLIEAQFKIQLRLADYKFEQAHSLEEIQRLHAEFLETFNTTPHWAHRKRAPGRRTPAQVLAWRQGRPVEEAVLHRLFQEVQFIRSVNRYGFVSVQRFYIYAEQGLSRQRVSVWIYEGRLRIEYQETLLTEYLCAYLPPEQRLQEVRQPILYKTRFASPQMELFELDETQWLKVRQRAYQRQLRRVTSLAQQLPLVSSGLLILALSHFLVAGVG